MEHSIQNTMDLDNIHYLEIIMKLFPKSNITISNDVLNNKIIIKGLTDDQFMRLRESLLANNQ
jgi:hypothetical protein